MKIKDLVAVGSCLVHTDPVEWEEQGRGKEVTQNSHKPGRVQSWHS